MADRQLFLNNVSAALSAGIAPADTTVPLSTGLGALLGTINANEFQIATVKDDTGAYEHVKVTAVAGDNVTVVRAQEGTSAQTFDIADNPKLSFRVYKGMLERFAQLNAEETVTAEWNFTGGVQLNGANIDRNVGGNYQCPYEGLSASRQSDTTLDVDASAVLLTDSSGSQKRFTSLNATVDITASGENGLDTGSEATSTWYYIHAIGKADGTVNALISTSRTSPTLPPGYTFWGLLGCVYNNGSDNFDDFVLNGDEVVFDRTSIIADTGNNTSRSSVSVASLIPPIAKAATGHLGASHDSSGNASMYIGGFDDADLGMVYTTTADSSGAQGHSPFRITLNPAAPQTLYWYADSSNSNNYASLSGYSL